MAISSSLQLSAWQGFTHDASWLQPFISPFRALLVLPVKWGTDLNGVLWVLLTTFHNCLLVSLLFFVSLKDQAAKDKALQSMATMSSAQIISPTAFQNKMGLQGLSRPPYPTASGVSHWPVSLNLCYSDTDADKLKAYILHPSVCSFYVVFQHSLHWYMPFHVCHCKLSLFELYKSVFLCGEIFTVFIIFVCIKTWCIKLLSLWKDAFSLHNSSNLCLQKKTQPNMLELCQGRPE